MDLGGVEWGTVPAWLGAGSLILAFIIFLRNRRNSERSQADLVGGWGDGEYELRAPGEAEVVEAAIRVHLRNASELPVMVQEVAIEVGTKWLVRDEEQTKIPVHTVVAGREPYRSFVYDVQLPPGETTELGPYPMNFAHLAPAGSRQLGLLGAVTVRMARLLVTDNAGRQWVVRPNKGSRARRVRRWQRT